MSPLFRRRRLRGFRVPGVTTAPEAVARHSHPTEPNRLWVTDVAVANSASGPLYVAVVLDCYSRHCLGWWIDRHLGPGLVIRAVEQAAPRRCAWPEQPLAAARPQDEVTLAVASRCETAGVAVPPGGSPSAIDGAVAHSFFSMLRSELVGDPSWATRTDAAESIASWIERRYNARRASALPAT
jgi:putative transposase